MLEADEVGLVRNEPFLALGTVLRGTTAEQTGTANPTEAAEVWMSPIIFLPDYLSGSLQELRWRTENLDARWSRGDFNADGVVDVADFNVWNQ